MRTLTELRQKITAIPSLFGASEEAQEPSVVSQATMNFQDGFTPATSLAIDSGGRYLQRSEFNQFGEISSREAYYGESGGIYTFDSRVSQYFEGYPKESMLYAFDGDMLLRVESTESTNTKPFANSNRKVIPNVIDCLVTKNSQDQLPPRILWKNVSWIYGLGSGAFRLALDYSRAHKLNKGDVLKEDSWVVGSKIAFIVTEGNYSVDALLPLSHVTTINGPAGDASISITNKGKAGDALGFFLVGVWSDSGIIWKQAPIPSVTGGTGNYQLSFFAKAGTSFDGIVQQLARSGRDVLYGDKTIEWTAIPFVPTCDYTENEGVAND